MTQYRAEAAERVGAKLRADRERRAEERRDRRERIESAALAELRAGLEAVRRAISVGDAAAIDAVNDASMPCIEMIADNVAQRNQRARRSTARRDAGASPRRGQTRAWRSSRLAIVAHNAQRQLRLTAKLTIRHIEPFCLPIRLINGETYPVARYRGNGRDEWV